MLVKSITGRSISVADREPMRLMLCAGQMRRDGWKTLDCKPGHDFVAMIPPLPREVKSFQWDEIEWIHGITSFRPEDGVTLLRELHGVLAEGGKLVLEQPDFNKARERVEWVFGDGEPLNRNRWAYTEESLYALLQKVGFSRIEFHEAQHHVPSRDFRVEAYR